MEEESPLVTIKDVCKLLSVSRRTVYNWMENGKLAYIRTPGGSIRIHRDQLTYTGKRK